MIDWTALLTAIGVVGSIILGVIALLRSVRQDRQNLAAKNLDEIFEGNQKLLDNYSKDNENLRKRVSELEVEMAQIKIEKQSEVDQLITERNELSHKLLKSQADNAKLISQLGGAHG